MSKIEDNFTQLQQRIAAACKNTPNRLGNVQLVAVSKRHSADRIRALYQLGQRDFAENYLQEALTKQQELADLDICWHFIGHVQKNKTRLIAEHFDWVHSVDRLIVAERLSSQRDPAKPEINVCLQVNIDAEASKSGLHPNELAQCAAAVSRLPGLRLRGLMAIPAAQASESERRRSMQAMKQLFDDLAGQFEGLDTLSMGMSADLEIAIGAGATMLRVGEALFGPRKP